MPNVIYCDSFDHYTDYGMGLKNFWYRELNSHIGTAHGRFGTGGMLCSSSMRMYCPDPSGRMTTTYFEIAMYSPSWPGGGTIVLDFTENGTTQLRLVTLPAGAMRIERGATVIGTSATGVIAANNWNHIGFKFTINNSTGVAELRVNEQTVINVGPIDTQNTSVDYWDGLTFGAASYRYDDLIISTDGFCGDCVVRCVYPDAVGFHNEWVASPYSYSYPQGMGTRTGQIVVTQNSTSPLFNGTGAQLIDGRSGSTIGMNAITVDSTKFVRFDFLTARTVNEARLFSNVTNYQGVWKWQGSADASTWTDIGAPFSFTTGGSSTGFQQFCVFYELKGNVTAYRYYQLVGVSGTGIGGGTHYEFEFQIDPAGSAPAVYTMVDEPIFDGEDDDFISTTVVGNRQTLNFFPLAQPGSIKAVQSHMAMRKDGPSSRVVQPLLRKNSTDFLGTSVSLPEFYTGIRQVYPNDPEGGAWTEEQFNLTQFGVKLVS